jgi:hypothetical protein
MTQGTQRIVTYVQAHGFVEIEDSGLPPWEAAAEFSAWLELAGFEKCPSRVVGNEEEFSPSLRTHHRTEKGTHRWYALVAFDDFERCEHIFVESAADYLALLATLAPVIAASAVVELRELRGVVGKAFRAWHGHDVGVACLNCNPEEVRRIEEARSKRWASKVGT